MLNWPKARCSAPTACIVDRAAAARRRFRSAPALEPPQHAAAPSSHEGAAAAVSTHEVWVPERRQHSGQRVHPPPVGSPRITRHHAAQERLQCRACGARPQPLRSPVSACLSASASRSTNALFSTVIDIVVALSAPPSRHHLATALRFTVALSTAPLLFIFHQRPPATTTRTASSASPPSPSHAAARPGHSRVAQAGARPACRAPWHEPRPAALPKVRGSCPPGLAIYFASLRVSSGATAAVSSLCCWGWGPIRHEAVWCWR